MYIEIFDSKSFISRTVFVLALALLLGFCAGSVLPVAAQEQDSKKEDTAASPAKAAPPAANDGFKWGFYEGHSEVEVGYRWVSDVSGNEDVYRSMVNLGAGPKLLRSNLSLRSNYGSGKLFDRLDLSFNNWGGDPYNTMHLNVGRADLYEFRADYRNMNYYNFLPVYANPLLSAGKLFGQHSLDVSYRTTNLELKLFPSRKIRPYFAYSRSSGFGPGFTTYGLTGNEFLLNTRWQYAADEYRGGVEISLPRLTFTVEQGYRFQRNDTGVTDSGNPNGNVSRPFLGQNIVLNDLSRSYHDRTTLPVSKAALKYTPFDNLKFTGRYIYSMADLDSSLIESNIGNFASLENLLFYKASADSFSGKAKEPNHNGAFLIEYSPFSRLTLLDQFDTQSFHISGNAVLASTFFNATSLAGPGGKPTDVKVTSLLGDMLAYDQVRNQAEAEYSLTSALSVHAGYRYTYTETSLQSSSDGESDSSTANMTQNTGIAGLSFIPKQWLNFTLDYEHNWAGSTLMRTDLANYDQFKFDGRLGPWKHISVNGQLAFLRNSNDQSDIDFRSHNRNYAIAVNYEPSERFSLSLDYARTTIYSNIAILLPQTLALDRSLFDERGDGIGGSMAFGLFRGSRVEFGYRGILNVGSYPLNFHQPFASFSVPLPNHLAFKGYWQYFGYNEKSTSIEDYRAHLVTLSIAYAF
jgi:hypothetical protein